MSIYYAALKQDIHPLAERQRVAGNLVKIRNQMAPLRAKKSGDKILLATWNVRDFGAESHGGFNPRGRLKESLFYIAELISSFDLVAVQEVNEDTRPLEKVMSLLGRNWDYIATDAFTFKGSRGERMCFIYDRTRVSFRNIAGEIVLPAGQRIQTMKRIKTGEKAEDALVHDDQLQFTRTPFLVAFQAGWFKFNLCTVHIFFGDSSTRSQAFERRKKEIAAIARFLARRQKKDNLNYILLGDFNIRNKEDVTMKMLTDNGFTVPEKIGSQATNVKRDKHYDQIAVRVKEGDLVIDSAGVVDIFANVFTSGPDGLGPYLDPVRQDKARDKDYKDKTDHDYFLKWRTWQLSDHNPLWVCIQTDFSDDYLKALIG